MTVVRMRFVPIRQDSGNAHVLMDLKVIALK